MASTSDHSRKKVCYFYDSEVGNFYFEEHHPMKPHRIRLAHNLIKNYGLYRKMVVYQPHKATATEMMKFHDPGYVKFLQRVTRNNASENKHLIRKYNSSEDCPIFHGLYEFCQITTGGSVSGAVNLNRKSADIAINWAGGFHHAHKSEASGFCYVNDIVLAILELLKYHLRVLYIDIDVHHGDGVEQAFYTTDRVMTVSFHKYGNYFPGTGELADIGAGKGRYYSMNFPLLDGIDDDSYISIFTAIIPKVVEMYRPTAIVLQCGADSLTGDRLGCFNLTLKGHAKCVELVKKFNLPLLLLGGGGYTIRNVARCWAYETAVALGVDLDNEIPYNDYYEYFGPDFKLHLQPAKEKNMNSSASLRYITQTLLQNLKRLPCAPSVEMQDIPPDSGVNNGKDNENDDENPGIERKRISIFDSDRSVSADNELSDSEGEGDGRRDQATGVRRSVNRYRYQRTNTESTATEGSESEFGREIEEKENDENELPVDVEGIAAILVSLQNGNYGAGPRT